MYDTFPLLCIQGIKELEAHLLEVTVQQSYLEEKIPQVWLNLEDKMIK